MIGRGVVGVIFGDAISTIAEYASISHWDYSSLNGTSSTLESCAISTLGGCSASTLGGHGPTPAVCLCSACST